MVKNSKGKVYVSKQGLTKPESLSSDISGKKFYLTQDFDIKEIDGMTVYGQKWLDSHPKEFWEMFRDTDDILIPHDYRSWLVGQPQTKESVDMILEEWIRKLKDTEIQRKGGVPVNRIIRERPGPYLLLIGAPGVGKSLIAKATAEDLERLYKKYGIELYDVLAFNNPHNQNEPRIRSVSAGMGRRIVAEATRKAIRKGIFKRIFIKFAMIFFIVLGIVLLLLTFYFIHTSIQAAATNCRDCSIVDVFGGSLLRFTPLLLPGAFLVIFPMFILFGAGMNISGFDKHTSVDIPKVLVDNSDPRYYEDINVASLSRLMGGNEWSPYGNHPTLAKPPHQRLEAGAVHKANRKVLFIDELRNLSIEAGIELLTVMEDGQVPIHDRGNNTTGTTSQNVASPPIDAMFLLMACGNEDLLSDPHSILNQLPALRDRFRYGRVIVLNDEMDATPQNELKVVQVVAQEDKRFNFPPVTREGCLRVIDFMKTNASSNKRMRIRFRSVIEILKAGAQLTWKEGKAVMDADIINRAIEIYAKPVEMQLMEQDFEKTKHYKILPINKPEIGMVNGLAVVRDLSYGEGIGVCFKIVSYVKKLTPDQLSTSPFRSRGSFEVTGISVEEGSWMQDSIQTVKTAIKMIYNINLEQDYDVHISFAQVNGVDGPSAGMAITLAVMSWLGNPTLPESERTPIPLYQNISATGTIELVKGEDGYPMAGAVGGIHQKTMASIQNKLEAVVMPITNVEHNVTADLRKKIKIIPAKSIMDYFNVLRADNQP